MGRALLWRGGLGVALAIAAGNLFGGLGAILVLVVFGTVAFLIARKG